MLKKIDLKKIDAFLIYEAPVRLVIMFFVGMVIGSVFKDVHFIFLGSIVFSLILAFIIHFGGYLYSKKKNFKKNISSFNSIDELIYSFLNKETPENIIKLLVEDINDFTEGQKIKETKINKILKSLLLNSIFKLNSIEEIEKLKKNPLILNNEDFLSSLKSREYTLEPEKTLIRKKLELENELINVNEKLSKEYSLSILRTE